MLGLKKLMDTSFGIPTMKQIKFFKAGNRYVAYGGARGGGKSWAVRYKATLLALANPGIKILLVRRTLNELRENHINNMLSCYSVFPKYIRPKYIDSKRIFIFSNRATIKLGYLSSEADLNQYQGQEYDVIFIDEATQITEKQFNCLCVCLRGANDLIKRMYLTCNPGGVGHSWVKRLFIDRKFKICEKPNDYTFLRARVFDNKPLLEKDPEFLGSLEKLPSALKDAWLYGRWDVFAGQYFSEWDDKVHVVKPFEIPKEWRRSVAIDYGLDMFAALFIAEDFSGNAYVYKEFLCPSLIVSAAAGSILKESGEETISEVLAARDLWNRRQESGMSAAEIFLKSGVPLIKAPSERVQGWLAVKEKLNAKEGFLRIFSSCEQLIHCMESLTYDKNNPSDVSVTPHDITHAPDALRYWCARKRLPPAGKEKKHLKDAFFLSEEEVNLNNYILGGF
ncbi:MAG: phage terminase large subunit [Eubacteriales bacterium]